MRVAPGDGTGEVLGDGLGLGEGNTPAEGVGLADALGEGDAPTNVWEVFTAPNESSVGAVHVKS
jgi:hypothetical protein